MKVARSAEDDCTAFGDTFLLIRPFSGELDPRFDGLSPGIHGQNHVIPKKLGNFLGKGAEYGIIKRSGGQSETLSLLHQGRHDAWMTMALVYGAKSEVSMNTYIQSEWHARERSIL